MSIQNDLKNGMSINNVCKKYNVSFKELMGRVSNRRHPRNLPAYIVRRGTKYVIHKRIDKKSKYFGSYYDLNDAIQTVNLLKQLNWKVNPADYMGDLFIVHKNNKYYLRHKSWNYTLIGGYNDLKTARKVRDLLYNFNWDIDYLQIIHKKLGVKI